MHQRSNMTDNTARMYSTEVAIKLSLLLKKRKQELSNSMFALFKWQFYSSCSDSTCAHSSFGSDEK